MQQAAMRMIRIAAYDFPSFVFLLQPILNPLDVLPAEVPFIALSVNGFDDDGIASPAGFVRHSADGLALRTVQGHRACANEPFSSKVGSGHRFGQKTRLSRFKGKALPFLAADHCDKTDAGQHEN